MIKDFNQAIVELLFQFDCVIIPNFGAFIKREKPACFSKDTQSFHPASVELIFNQQLKEDDALLLKYIQLKNEFTTSEAATEIKNYVEELRITLFNEGIVQFEGLGKMTLNIYDQIIFNSHPQIPLLQKQFGFQSLSLEPILKAEKATKTPRKAKLRYIAAAITIPVFLISTWASLHPEKVKDTYYHYASMVPFQTSEKQLNYTSDFVVEERLSLQSEKDALIEKLVSKLKSDNIACYDSPELEGATPVKEISEPILEEKIIPVEKPFHIVVGAFASKRNANKKLKQLKRKGFEGVILKEANSRLHRVSAKDFISEAEAEAVLADFKIKFKGAWILNNQ